MTAATYRYSQGSIHDGFFKSRAKIRVFAGGFGNGKTAAACVLALKLARDYPGSNGLIARATYPKLNDTIRKEFTKWCPASWIKSFPTSANSSNTCTLSNGTTINFRYVQQKGQSTEQTTSNLLSATYDWIVVDQIEDPEITHKDFLDLLGRLRGMAVYNGNDNTMPSTGPRWFIITCNPTRNWFYKKIVKALHVYNESGKVTDDLLWDHEANKPIIEIFEGSTYENQDNLTKDFIETLEITYKGQMRDRFLMGKWAAYEGLVYPSWNSMEQFVNHHDMLHWFRRQFQDFSRMPTIIEGYDYGLAKPACYGFWFADLDGNMHLLDGFYEKELSISGQAQLICDIRKEYLSMLPSHKFDLTPYADPAIFRRQAGRKIVGESIAEIFASEKSNPIVMQRGNNDIINGIAKVTSFLLPRKAHRNPYTGNYPASLLYVSDKCPWFDDEIGSYMWKKDTSGDAEDQPEDKNDHAMDMTKFALSDRPIAAQIHIPEPSFVKQVARWHEEASDNRQYSPRYC